MKNFLRISCLFAVLLFPSGAFSQLFMQNFSSSPLTSAYVDAAPDNTEFTSIGSTAGTSVSISADEQLLFEKNTGGMGWFARTADFAPAPQTLMIQFTLSVPTTGGAVTTACLFRVGHNFNDGSEPPSTPLADTWARFGINYTATTGQFSVRNVTAGTNSVNFTGEQQFTWVLNNSGAALDYYAPTGAISTVANGTYDIWVGTTNVQNDVAAVTPSVPMTDFKFVFLSPNNGSSLRIDNLYINTLGGDLPSANYSVGARGNFRSITNPGGVFNVINNLSKIDAGGYTFTVNTDIAETGQNPLRQVNDMQAGNEINIKSDGVLRTLTCGTGLDFMRFLGGDFVNINGNHASAKTLRFRKSAGGSVFYFQDNSDSIRVQDVFIEGTTGLSALINIATDATTGDGNDNISFFRCDIRNRSDIMPTFDANGSITGNFPSRAIRLSGTAGKANSFVSFSHCNIFNFYVNNGSFHVIDVVDNSDFFRFEHNSYYQEYDFIGQTAGGANYMTIFNAGANNTNLIFVGNHIGGRAPNCAGGHFVFRNIPGGNRFRLRTVFIAAASSLIRNNEIANLEMRFYRTVQSCVNEESFRGFVISGNTIFQNNRVGVISTNNSIEFYQETNNSMCMTPLECIVFSGSGTFEENKVGGIVCHFNSPSDFGFNLQAFRLSPSSPITVLNNLVGSNALADNVKISSHASVNQLSGFFHANNTAVTFSQNEVKNISNFSTSVFSFAYAFNKATTANNSYTQNTIAFVKSSGSVPHGTDNVSAAGFWLAGGGTDNLDLNTIYEIQCLAPAGNPSIAAALVAANGTSGSITRNRIYAVRNYSEGANPVAAGMLFRNFGANLRAFNNMIALGKTHDGSNLAQPTHYIGFWNNATSANAINFSFNSVALEGNSVGAAYNTYAFLRGDLDGNPATLVTTPTQVFNNLFHNKRGGAGTHFAIGNTETPLNWATAPPCGTSPSPDFNAFYSNSSASIGEWLGTAYNFANWKTNSTADTYSSELYAGPVSFFNVDIADLHVPVTEHRLDGFGLPLPALTLEDYDGEFRRGPDIGADEVENTIIFTGPGDDWHDANNWDLKVVPTCADNVIIPNGMTARIYPSRLGLFYSLTIQNGGTLILTDATTALEGCWLKGTTIVPYAVAHNGFFDNQGTFIANDAIFGKAGEFGESNNFVKGTSLVLLNLDVPNVNPCLANFIATFNSQSPVSNISGTDSTRFHRLSIINNGQTSIISTKDVYVGDEITDLGWLNIDGSGWFSINGNRLILDGDLLENTGTIAGSPLSDLVIRGQGNLTGTVKIRSNNGSDNAFEYLTAHRPTGGKIVFDQVGGITQILVKEQLNLTDGVLKTGTSVPPQDLEIYVQNPSTPGGIINHNTRSYVYGYLRRRLNSSGDYAYPLGDDTRYELLHMNITGNLGTNSVRGYFDPNDATDTGGLPLSELGNTYTDVCTGGFWNLEPETPPAVSAQYDIELTPVGIVCPGDMTIAKRPNSAAAWSFAGSTYVNPDRRNGYTDFSDYAYISDIDLLPLELIAFRAEKAENDVKLFWQTVRERNFSNFDLERSEDGSRFEKIAEISGGAREGKYSFTDKNLLPGEYFYRLKMNEHDGTFRYSQTLRVLMDNTGVFLLAPNPLNTDVVRVYLPQSNRHVFEILTPEGKLVYEYVQTTASDTENLDLKGLPNGLYLFRVKSANDSKTLKLLIGR